MTMIPSIEVPATIPTEATSDSNNHSPKQVDTMRTSLKTMDITKEDEQFERGATKNDEQTKIRIPINDVKSRSARSPRSNRDDDGSVKLINLTEKLVIVHRDENGFGLRVKGQAPVFVEHVHENGAAWRAGVRKFDLISKVNGSSVSNLDHKEVVLMFKSCSRFVGLTLLSSQSPSYYLQRQSIIASDCEPAIDNSRLTNNDFSLNCASAIDKPDEATNVIGVCHHHNLNHHHHRRRHHRQQQQQQQQQLQQRLLLASSGSTQTLLNLNLKQRHQYQLSGNGDDEYAVATDYRQLIECPIGSPNHKWSLISMSGRRQYNDNDNNNNNNDEDDDDDDDLSKGQRIDDLLQECDNKSKQQSNSAAKRSESVSYKPCYLSIPQSSSSYEQYSAGGCICVSCRRSMLKFAANERRDDCEQCRLIRSSTSGFIANRLTPYGQHPDGGSAKSLTKQQVTLATSNKLIMDNREPQTISSNYKLSQSASTSSLPAESTQRTAGSKVSATSQSSKTQTDPTRAPIAPRALQTNKRLEIIRELIDTERTHTDRLRCLDELFYRPLKSGGFMTSEQLRMVFSCHRTLYKIHRQIYRTLLSVNYNLYPEPLIGSALIEIFEGDLKRRLERAACNFCASQSSNAELLNKFTRRDTKVGEFLAHVTSQQMVGRLGIKDLLASCFQRLTKYPLLLENLLKATPQVPPELSPIRGHFRRASQQALSSRQNRKLNSSIEGDDNDGTGSQEADDDETAEDDEELEDEEQRKAREDSQKIMAISLAEEREFIERALNQSRQILVRVNESVKEAISHNKLKEIWKRTDKYPGVPLIDITKQQVVHEGLLTLRLSKRSFDVHVLLLNDYLIILTREGQDKYRLKFFTPDGKSSNNNSVYSPVFVIDEHLTTRDAATDENGFYLLCKRKDDSRIYEFASRSPVERSRWRDKIQWTIERQMGKTDRRRSSCESQITKSSSEISSSRGDGDDLAAPTSLTDGTHLEGDQQATREEERVKKKSDEPQEEAASKQSSNELTKIAGTISLVEDDGIIQPSKMESSQALVDQAIQVNICDIGLEKAAASS